METSPTTLTQEKQQKERDKRNNNNDTKSFSSASSRFYRSVDSLDFLRVQVTLTRLPSRSLLGAESSKPETVHMEVAWQFKMIGPNQLRHYQSTQSPSRLELKYLSAISKLLKRNTLSEPIGIAKVKHGMALSTNVQDDGYIEGRGMFDPSHPNAFDTDNHHRTSSLVNALSDLINYFSTSTRDERSEHVSSILRPTKRIGRRDLDLPYSEMYIMASIAPISPDGSSIGGMKEVQLGAIKAFGSRGLLSFSPPLDVPAEFQLDGITYQFTLRNMSENFTLEEEERERVSYYAYSFTKLDADKQDVAHAFAGPNSPVASFYQLPDDFVYSISVLAQIKSAHSFPHSKLYIQYSINFPEGWWLDENAPDQGEGGFTQVSSCTFDRERQVHCSHFAFPIEFRAFSRTENIQRFPTIYFQVFGLESWNRHIPCGYGSYKIPSRPGKDDCIAIHTWKPLASASAAMSTYFVGGGNECKDVEWVGATYSSATSSNVDLPEDVNWMLDGQRSPAVPPHPPAVLNRAGVATQTSGVVELSCQTLHQRSWFPAPSKHRSWTKRSISTAGGGNKGLNHHSVLERAKTRVSVLKDLKKISIEGDGVDRETAMRPYTGKENNSIVDEQEKESEEE